MFGLTRQIRRAATSIPSNIEEGHERWSRRETVRFLLAKYPTISKGDPEQKYANRRNISLEQGNAYKKLMEGEAGAVCLKVFDGGKPVSYGRTKIQGKTIVGTNEYFLLANSYALDYGRNISPEDVELGRDVTVVGNDVERKLFQ